MSSRKDVDILRDLARCYRDAAAKPVQDHRRALWRAHNSFERTRPLVLVMISGGCWRETPQSSNCCEDPFYRAYEDYLRRRLFQDEIGDDTILEPWITQSATYITPPDGPWGVRYGHIPSTEARGSWQFDPPIRALDDVHKLVSPKHKIDEEATRRDVARLRDAVGDILEVNIDRAPYLRNWHADISYTLAQLRGIEQVMWDMVDHPDWLHELCAFLRDGALAIHAEAEDAGDWRLCDHNNQAMPYCRELPDPAPNGGPMTRDKLWCFMAAQEMAQVSPAMHEAFVLEYQLPIMSKFGLSAYGCCEDLTHKIDMLRRAPNLRRIGVTPVADVARCAEQIGDDYIYSWRPSPAEMICCGFYPDRVSRTMKDAMEATRGCHVDITLKDVETVLGHPEHLGEWVRTVRAVTDSYA